MHRAAPGKGIAAIAIARSDVGEFAIVGRNVRNTFKSAFESGHPREVEAEALEAGIDRAARRSLKHFQRTTHDSPLRTAQHSERIETELEYRDQQSTRLNSSSSC